MKVQNFRVAIGITQIKKKLHEAKGLKRDI